MPYTTCTVPAGDKITIAAGKLNVPARPIIPYIEGDGTGPDIWRATRHVLDAAVQKAYGGERQIGTISGSIADGLTVDLAVPVQT